MSKSKIKTLNNSKTEKEISDFHVNDWGGSIIVSQMQKLRSFRKTTIDAVIRPSVRN